VNFPRCTSQVNVAEGSRMRHVRQKDSPSTATGATDSTRPGRTLRRHRRRRGAGRRPPTRPRSRTRGRCPASQPARLTRPTTGPRQPALEQASFARRTPSSGTRMGETGRALLRRPCASPRWASLRRRRQRHDSHAVSADGVIALSRRTLRSIAAASTGRSVDGSFTEVCVTISATSWRAGCVPIATRFCFEGGDGQLENPGEMERQAVCRLRFVERGAASVEVVRVEAAEAGLEGLGDQRLVETSAGSAHPPTLSAGDGAATAVIALALSDRAGIGAAQESARP
jgi:hypothetical protein